MYLEISPRQSGKTKRMIDAILAHVSAGNVAYVQTHSEHYFRDMLNSRLKPKLHMTAKHKNIVFLRDEDHFTQLRRGMVHFEDRPRVFADEVDFVGDRLVLNPQGYYCGTPKYQRTQKDIVLWMMGERVDKLLDAIEMNGGKHESYSPFNMFMNRTIADIKSMRMCMSKEQYQNEVFGSIYG
jgi:hypothetical protein